MAALELGAGRHKKGDPVNHAVGVVIHHKVGEHVQKADQLFTIHARTSELAEQASKRVLAAYQWSECAGPPLFYDVIFSK